MNLMDKGSKFETKKIEIFVEKPGISSFVFKFAHKFSFIYGIFSAIIAVGLGISAGFIFKKKLRNEQRTYLFSDFRWDT